MQSENQPAQRFATKEKASLEVYGRKSIVLAEVKNMSKSGVCVEWSQSEVDLIQGDIVSLTIILKTLGRRHKVSAQVVWLQGNTSGLNFIRDDQLLEKIVEKT
jgi:hypothetical protein